MKITIELNEPQLSILKDLSIGTTYEEKIIQIISAYLDNYSDDVPKAKPFDRNKLGI